ncbi:hypothetical protein HPB52_009917 [Rhipicephalus sanguineus]|uniref:Endonuclease/exonuclease/phosphatase domain-containing protein n=1 Tax=Rhipicephalus sanguineus TaxID=34632 RepID=A0A9D4SY61_RHISA|nr:hypothetical protein HPB52_009917 [Rhipicephalus sanguineus]
MLIQSGRPETAAAKTPVGSPQLETKTKAKETAAGSQRGSYVDILLDNVAISKEGPGSEDQQIQSTDSREDMREPEGTKTSTMSREARGNNQMAKRGESKKSGDRTGTHGGRQNIQTKAESERRVFVFGDGNALRMKWATLHTVGWNQNVQFRAETATTLREVAEAVDAELERWGTDEAMVVIHAGCKEVLSGSEPHEEILNDLRAQLQRGTSEILNTCKRWNDGMRSMCRELGPWVELAASNSFREEVPDNLIYSENMAKDIGKHLGRRLCAFLDVRPARSQWREKWRSGYRANSVMETLSQALAERWQGTQAYVGFPGANGTGMEVDCGQSGERKAQGQQTRCLPQGRRRRRGPRKKASSQAEKVGFLNMQGGRTEQKWGELVKIMHEEHFALMAVAETHLRDQEVPPSDTGFAWEGCNRQNGERRGGGLGCMWRLPQQWTRIKAECSEHMWLSGNIAGRWIALAVVYLWTGAQMQKNTEICQCLRGDVEDVRREAEIIIMGDFNAHLEDLDGRTDANGRLLQELACSAGLVIANLTEKCCGMTTWSVRDQQSCIDYCLLSESLYEHLQGMVIDEDGKGNLASDHNRIQLIFKGGFQQGRSQRPAVSARPNEKALQQMAAEVEEHADTLESYDMLVEELRRALKEWKPGTGRRRGLKPWWNGEVAEAIRHRQEASRAHRHLSRGGDTEAILRAWDVYRTRKLEAATLVQSCIRAVNQRFMADLKSAGKQAPQRFWRYIKRQDRPTPQRILRQASDGEDKTGKECLPLLEKWIESLQQRCDMEGVPINAEGPYTWPVAEEQTEAVAKAGYENRLVRLPEQNVARRMLVYEMDQTHSGSTPTFWVAGSVFGESKRGGED